MFPVLSIGVQYKTSTLHIFAPIVPDI